MPTTVAEALSTVGLVREAVVRWGTRPSTDDSGVYVVSLTDSVDAIEGTLTEAPLAPNIFETWLQVRPELTLDGRRPTVEQLVNRIQGFWLADESVLYIGLATSLSSRLAQYYKTPIGARRPHAGGYFLKLLSNLDNLWVHYAPCDDPDSAEDGMLRQFCAGVSAESKRALIDPTHPFPFANLEWPQGVRKAHGLLGAREPRTKKPVETEMPPQLPTPGFSKEITGSHPTQRLTAADLRAGQIRIPSTGVASTKGLFPPTKADVEVVLKGQVVHGSWNPRMGPDKERSGVLRIGSALRELVHENEVLAVAVVEQGAIVIR